MRALGGAGSAPRAQTNRNASSPAPAVSTPPPPSAIDALVNKFPPFDAATIGRAATSTAGYPGADTQHRGVFVVDVPKLRKDWENVQVTKTRSATHTVECTICRQAGMPRWFKDEAAMRRHRDLHYRAACIFCGRVAAARTDIFTSHCREGKCAVHRELSAVKGAVAAWLKRHGLAHHWQLGLGGQ